MVDHHKADGQHCDHQRQTHGCQDGQPSPHFGLREKPQCVSERHRWHTPQSGGLFDKEERDQRHGKQNRLRPKCRHPTNLGVQVEKPKAADHSTGVGAKILKGCTHRAFCGPHERDGQRINSHILSTDRYDRQEKRHKQGEDRPARVIKRQNDERENVQRREDSDPGFVALPAKFELINQRRPQKFGDVGERRQLDETDCRGRVPFLAHDDWDRHYGKEQRNKLDRVENANHRENSPAHH